jgi:methylamine dehydrogenase accessory protein MauD
MSGWWITSYVVLWFLVIALTLLVLALARQLGTLHLRLGPRGALEMDDEGPPLGQAPPRVDAVDVDGRPVTIGGPGAEQFLLFVSPGCPVCREVLPSVRVVAQSGAMEAVVVADTEPNELPREIDARRFGAVLVAQPELATTYNVPGTPYAVVLDSVGVVRAKGTVNNLEQMEGLVDTARRRLAGAASPLA